MQIASKRIIPSGEKRNSFGSLTADVRSMMVAITLRIFTKLSCAISLSNIDALPQYSLFKQIIHVISYAHHVDGTAKEFLQIILYKIECEQ